MTIEWQSIGIRVPLYWQHPILVSQPSGTDAFVNLTNCSIQPNPLCDSSAHDKFLISHAFLGYEIMFLRAKSVFLQS